jgi:hypothetical protein
MISTAGGVLLAQTARISGLDRHLCTNVRLWRRSRAIHDPAKILLDLAIAVALGGDCAADIALLRAQPGVFGLVASDPTVSRAVDDLAGGGADALSAIRTARASAREWVWQRAGTPHDPAPHRLGFVPGNVPTESEPTSRLQPGQRAALVVSRPRSR